ncbi:MAG: hypothetical protein AAGE37_08385 [Pseudomonadota bacterium]
MIEFVIYLFMVVTISLICRKTGHPVWLGILCFVPVLGQIFFIVLVYYLAFSDWPRWTEAGLDQMSGTQADLDQIFD